MFSIYNKYPDLFVAFSEKKDGSMKLTENAHSKEKISQNRNKYFEKIGVDPDNAVSAEIIHGNLIEEVSNSDCGKIISNADGLVTDDKNIYLSITSADCLPIFLFEPEKKIVGMVHAGWKSLEKNILANAVGEILDLGGSPNTILVGIGPAICQKHYKIGPEVAEKFEKYPEATERQYNKIFLDIKKIAERQLLNLGLLEKNIEISPECTFELPEKYFSARRDKEKEIEAMVAVIGMKK